MDTAKPAAIQQALKPVVGLPLQCIGRAANVAWLHFGEMREVDDLRGDRKTVGDWAIHIQCPWRLSRLSRIVIASDDYAYAPNGDYLMDGWSHPGRSRFDFIAAKLCTEFEIHPPVVTSMQVDDVGGFSLGLADDYRLDVFPSSSDESDENWRLFEPSRDTKHFVF
jgi:hypothetical protein